MWKEKSHIESGTIEKGIQATPQSRPLLKGSPEIYVDIILKFRASTCMNMNAHAEFLRASVKQQKEPDKPFLALKKHTMESLKINHLCLIN